MHGEGLAAGAGKQFMELAGKPLIAWGLAALEAARSVSSIIVVVGSAELEKCRGIVAGLGLTKVAAIVEGGPERQDSSRLGLAAVPRETSVVVIHDGARPLVEPGLIDRAVDGLDGWDGVVVAIPAQDTMKLVEGDAVKETLDRSRLWQAQTPQVFRYDVIAEAHGRALRDGFAATDDAMLVERLGKRVRIIKGSELNLKVTTPVDLVLAEAILRAREAGGLW